MKYEFENFFSMSAVEHLTLFIDFVREIFLPRPDINFEETKISLIQFFTQMTNIETIFELNSLGVYFFSTYSFQFFLADYIWNLIDNLEIPSDIAANGFLDVMHVYGEFYWSDLEEDMILELAESVICFDDLNA